MTAAGGSSMALNEAHFNMIEQQIRTWDVLDQKVLDLLGDVDRGDFVPEAYRDLAYADIAVPLDHGQVMMLGPASRDLYDYKMC